MVENFSRVLFDARDLGGRRRAADSSADLKRANVEALHRAIDDQLKTFGSRYPRGEEFLGQAIAYEKQAAAVERAQRAGDAQSAQKASALAEKIERLRRKALLANPLLDCGRLLLVKRGNGKLGLPQNWQANCAIGSTGYDNQIAVLSPIAPQGKLTPLLKPAEDGVRRRHEARFRRR